jgi:hypothetical protein
VVNPYVSSLSSFYHAPPMHKCTSLRYKNLVYATRGLSSKNRTIVVSESHFRHSAAMHTLCNGEGRPHRALSLGCPMMKVYGLDRRLVTRVGTVSALSVSVSMPRLRLVGSPTSWSYFVSSEKRCGDGVASPRWLIARRMSIEEEE